MTSLSQKIEKLSQKIFNLSKRLEYFHVDSAIFKYRDCFETIDILLKLFTPQFLCDVGANSGNWASVLHQMNPNLRHIVFFEPQKYFYQKLESLSLPGVSKVIYPYGLGNQEETLIIKGGTASASFLNSTEMQDLYFPNSLSSDSEAVPIKVLDCIYQNSNLPTPDLIKLDVQGFELNVLQGAVNTISEAKCLVIELSFREFYNNQPNTWEILKFLEENNYMMISKGYEWRSPHNRQELLQMDGIFMNKRFLHEFDHS